MNAATPIGFDEWMPRRAGLLLALGIWMAGFALTGAVAWRMHHQDVVGAADGRATSAQQAVQADPDDDKAEPGTSFMPEDTVVAHRSQHGDSTMMQGPKP
ncbi:MAG TPA: hypothetical protein VH044_04470 [Polyangiaceae bacterium]|jgi:hypothetical protein|nr:hypothetical protein [Polyangiaceae bacterium]